MSSEKRQVKSTIFTVEVKDNKVITTCNGKVKEHKKSFWLKLTLNDFLEYTKEISK